MADEKFAFESGKVSIAFALRWGLGDDIISKKVFEALIELVPDCVFDIFYQSPFHRTCAEAFYGDSKNLNLILNREEFFKDLVKKYDLALCVMGSHCIYFDHINSQRLEAMSPALSEAVKKIQHYNENNYVYSNTRDVNASYNMRVARILNKSCYEFLSCDGALPIRDTKVKIPLKPEYKSEFNSLNLKNYITFYNDLSEGRKPKNKTWPIRYLSEYITLMKRQFPYIEIVQCGGGGDVKVENADRHFLNIDLELTKHILANSLLHVGTEGGLVHLATQLGTKCLVPFGANEVNYFGYPQNINIISDVCSPCMYLLPDWTACLRGFKESPCMSSITPQRVFEETCKYLDSFDFTKYKADIVDYVSCSQNINLSEVNYPSLYPKK